MFAVMRFHILMFFIIVNVFSDFSSRLLLELGSQDIVKYFNCICTSPKLISVIFSLLSDTFVIVY